MSDATFLTRADTTLRRLMDRLEDATDALDVEYRDGVLTITPDDGPDFVVNRHTASAQIWLSSPISGAWHYALAADGSWRATRGGERLEDRLAADLAAVLGTAPGLD